MCSLGCIVARDAYSAVMDFAFNPYPSGSMPVMARRGLVAPSQPLAAQAGLPLL